ncbi:hypothetical protein F4824DRAFT_372270 [Ustulina deusta]|nr:hypothetical protein F4824DRAFT_372270 [Ustulina deusta]
MRTSKMSSPTEVLQGMQWLQSRDSALPAVCYDTCNNANIEAQAVGKSPELCDEDSVFWTYYNACSDCAHSYTDNVTATTFLDSGFGQYIEYCGVTGPEPITLSTTNNPSLMEETVIITIPFTATVDGMTTVWPLTKTLTSFAPLPDTTVIVVKTSQDGHPTLWTFTKTLTELPSDSLISMSQNISSSFVQQDTSKSTPEVPEATASNQTSTITGNNAPRSQAWVAGPIIGAVAGVTILLVATWLLFRLRKEKESKRRRHELNGESALKSELESKIPPQELGVQGQDGQPVELPSSSSYNRLE